MSTPFSSNRRDFLRRSACATLGVASAGAMLSQLGLVNAALAASPSCVLPGGNDYRALVCVFLFGGNDSFNLLVPNDATRYPQYAAARGAMALPKEQLIALNTLGAASGEHYGVHPQSVELAQLFNAGHAAFVVNTGTLVKPTDKAQYLSGSHPLPPQLFSHADQQGLWQYGRPLANGSTGWGGLSADRLQILNAGATIPMSISLSGQNRFQAGLAVQPYTLASSGPTSLQGYAPGKAPMNALQELLNQAQPDPLSRGYSKTLSNALDYYAAMSTALAGATPIATKFPDDNPLGDALKMIASIISTRTALSAKRQIFFVGLGGFDTHDDQLELQPQLFKTLSQALGAFYAATQELGVANRVTTFTMSEFSRTLNSDGDGTDHAWAGHQLVMGGAVQGQRLYGTPAKSGGLFPQLLLDGSDCLARGQMVPATSSDQYAATLARWAGLGDCEIAEVFPTVGAFPTSNLGFLG